VQSTRLADPFEPLNRSLAQLTEELGCWKGNQKLLFFGKKRRNHPGVKVLTRPAKAVSASTQLKSTVFTIGSELPQLSCTIIGCAMHTLARLGCRWPANLLQATWVNEKAGILCFLHDNLELLIWTTEHWQISWGVSFHIIASTSVAVTNATSLIF